MQRVSRGITWHQSMLNVRLHDFDHSLINSEKREVLYEFEPV